MVTLTQKLVITDGIPGLPSSFSIPLPDVEIAQWEADLAQALVGGYSIDGKINGTLKASGDTLEIDIEASEDSETMPATFAHVFTIATSGVIAFAADALLGSAGKQFAGTYTASLPQPPAAA